MEFDPEFVDIANWEADIEVSEAQDKDLYLCLEYVVVLRAILEGYGGQLVVCFEGDSSVVKTNQKNIITNKLQIQFGKIQQVANELDDRLIWFMTPEASEAQPNDNPEPNHEIGTKLKTNLNILKNTIYKYLHQLDEDNYPPINFGDDTHTQSVCPYKASYCTKISNEHAARGVSTQDVVLRI